jgi:hypothetical protein
VTRFRIDPERSRVVIDARSNVHPIHSEAGGVEGFVEVDLDEEGGVAFADPPAGRLSFPVSNLTSGNGLEDREMLRRTDARKFPTIDGVLTSAAADGDRGRFRVSGDVMFRGVTRRCEDFMHLEVAEAGRTVRLTGESTFDIRDFGMEPPRVLLLRVEPKVSVKVVIVAGKEG